MITEFNENNLSKSQIERDNCAAIIEAMPLMEKILCKKMIQALQLSLADPKTGQTFMMAMAFSNADMACALIEAGIVNANGRD